MAITNQPHFSVRRQRALRIIPREQARKRAELLRQSVSSGPLRKGLVQRNAKVEIVSDIATVATCRVVVATCRVFISHKMLGTIAVDSDHWRSRRDHPGR